MPYKSGIYSITVELYNEDSIVNIINTLIKVKELYPNATLDYIDRGNLLVFKIGTDEGYSDE